MRHALLSLVVCFVAASVVGEAPDDYYDAAAGLSGGELRAALHEIINDHTKLPYTSSQTDTWDVIHLADEAPGDASRILDLYRNRTFLKDDHWSSSNTTGWNREHSWPKSYGFTDDGDCNYPYTDVHHLFATDPDYNEARGNIPYDWAPSGSEAFPVDGLGFANYRYGQYENGYWEVWPLKRGDVARAMFYMDVRYEGGKHGITGCTEPDLRLTNDRSDFVWSSSQNLSVAYMGILSTLIEWHLEDPPDERERRRNDIVFQFQGNRNPFVDHPEYVCEIYACPIVPDIEAPSVPVFLSVTASKTSATLSWVAPADEDVAGYVVYRRKGSGGYQSLTSTPIVSTTFTDETLTAGVEYGYAVSAVDSSRNESAKSRDVRVVTGMNLRAYQVRENGASGVALEWTGAETTLVDIWRDGSLLATTENDSSWVDSNPLAWATYRLCEAESSECTPDVSLTLAERRRGATR